LYVSLNSKEKFSTPNSASVSLEVDKHKQAMTSGYILILAVLVLGGVIAASGDRIGSKVGKARLTLFKLRPKQTATLVTIATGCLISASTLGVLFGTSEQLRTGVFDLKRIQKKLSRTSEELVSKEQELAQVKSEQNNAQSRLKSINDNLKQAIAIQSATAKKLVAAQKQFQVVSQQRFSLINEIKQLQRDRQDLVVQKNQIKLQVNTLQNQVGNLTQEINGLRSQLGSLYTQVNQLKEQIGLRDREIAKRDLTITQRNRIILERQQLEVKLKDAIVQRESQLKTLSKQLESKEVLLSKRQVELKQLESKLMEKDRELQSLEVKLTERESQLADRERQIGKLDTQLKDLEVKLTQRDRQLKELEAQMKQKEARLATLESEVKNLEKNLADNYQALRQGRFGVFRNEVLAAGVFSVIDPTAARSAIDSLLTQANRKAIAATRVNSNSGNARVVQIRPTEIEKLLDTLKDGKYYLVRIISTGNYLVGETQVEVYADAILNRLVFSQGQVLAQVSTDLSNTNQDNIRKLVNQLLATSELKSNESGMLGEIQIDGRDYADFLTKLNQYKDAVEVEVVVEENTYTSGPLKIKLVASANGQVLFTT
jgi:uncharacterized protein (DUF3084 family)